MKKPLSSAVDALRSASAHLNAASDRAAETVRAVEKFLGEECRVGVTAHVLVDSYFEEQVGLEVATYLSYERIGNHFRIAVGTAIDGQPDGAKPWSDCSRDDKLETIEKLPELLAAVSEAVQARVAKADEAARAADEMLAQLRANAPKS